MVWRCEGLNHEHFQPTAGKGWLDSVTRYFRKSSTQRKLSLTTVKYRTRQFYDFPDRSAAVRLRARSRQTNPRIAIRTSQAKKLIIQPSCLGQFGVVIGGRPSPDGEQAKQGLGFHPPK